MCRFFWKWHGLVPRLIYEEQLVLASRQTPTERKEPSKILFGKVGDEFSLFPEMVRPHAHKCRSEPNQLTHVLEAHTDDAKEMHRLLVQFMCNTEFPIAC